MESLGVLWEALSQVAALLNAKLIEGSAIVATGVGQLVDLLAK